MAIQTHVAENAQFSLDDIYLGCAQSITVTMTNAINSATCQGSGGSTESTYGRSSWTGSVGALMRTFTEADLASNISAKTVAQKLLSKQIVDVTFDFGGIELSGKALLSSVTPTSGEEGNITWSFEMTGTGPLDIVD